MLPRSRTSQRQRNNLISRYRDYCKYDRHIDNRDLIGQREILQLSMETANNRIEINKINSDMISLEKQISDVTEFQDMEIAGKYSDEGFSGHLVIFA